MLEDKLSSNFTEEECIEFLYWCKTLSNKEVIPCLIKISFAIMRLQDIRYMKQISKEPSKTSPG